MSSQEEFDRYSTELARRFEDLTQWAIEHWPNSDYPLMSSDFSESRKELQQILGHKLSQAQSSESNPPSDDQAQYLPLHPAPWP